MPRILSILSSLAALAPVLAVAAAGCSSSSPAPAGCQQATVSFKNDVMPVFQQSCTITGVCHGQMNNAAEEDLFLGEHTTDTAADISATYMGLINMKAKEIPSMNLVTPGDLENSFLWHKVHDTMDVLTSSLGSQCTLAMSKCGDCNPTMPCGSTMPYNGGAIDPGFECTIQNWIMGGAQNN
jgi:hypothetical protein